MQQFHVLLLFTGICCCRYLPFPDISIVAARGCAVQRCLPQTPLLTFEYSPSYAALHLTFPYCSLLLLFKTFLAFGCFPVYLLFFLASVGRLLQDLLWHSFMQIHNSSSATVAFTHTYTYTHLVLLQYSLLFCIFSHYLFSCAGFSPSAYRSVEASCNNHSKSQHTSRRSYIRASHCFPCYLAF